MKKWGYEFLLVKINAGITTQLQNLNISNSSNRNPCGIFTIISLKHNNTFTGKITVTRLNHTAQTLSHTTNDQHSQWEI